MTERNHIDAACHDAAKEAFTRLLSTMQSAPSTNHKVALDLYNAQMAAIGLARTIAEPGWSEKNAKEVADREQAARDAAAKNQGKATQTSGNQAIGPLTGQPRPQGQFQPAPLTSA